MSDARGDPRRRLKFPWVAALAAAGALSATAAGLFVVSSQPFSGEDAGNPWFPGAATILAVLIGIAAGVLDRRYSQNQRIAAERAASQLRAEREGLRGVEATEEALAKLDRVEQELASLRAVPFADEADRIKWAARFGYFTGSAIVIVVLVMGLRDWFGDDDLQISTGAGIARLGVITAAFYLAGQFFRRATALATIGSEFQRAAIAMRSARDLSEQLQDPDQRDLMLRHIYESHLARGGIATDPASGPAADKKTTSGTDPAFDKILDVLAKRGQGA